MTAIQVTPRVTACEYCGQRVVWLVCVPSKYGASSAKKPRRTRKTRPTRHVMSRMETPQA